MDKSKPFYKSKKFWTMIITVLLGLLKAQGVEIPPETFVATTGYIIGQGIADSRKQ